MVPAADELCPYREAAWCLYSANPVDDAATGGPHRFSTTKSKTDLADVESWFPIGNSMADVSGDTRFRMEQIALLAFCGYHSLYVNFLYGQYYVFLLFLLTLAFYCVHREHSLSSGFFAGVAFGLKLYGGPFLLYFAAKRNWKAVAGLFASLEWTSTLTDRSRSGCGMSQLRKRSLLQAEISTAHRRRGNRIQ